mgnify:FL=1
MEQAVKSSRRNRWFIAGGILAVSLLGVILAGTSSSGGTTEEAELEPERKEYYVIYSLDIPDQLSFCGEPVPLDLFDVRESLDKELLSNTYFHSQTIRLIKLCNRHFPVIEPILQEQGVPEDFKYLAVIESGLDNVVSPANAVGVWQLTRGTARDYGLEVNAEVDERYHLEKATKAACSYLLESYEKYGNWTMSAASYNAGRRGMDRQIERQKQDVYYDLLLNDETARYMFRILAFKMIYENPSAYGFQIPDKDLYQPVPYRTVEVDGPVLDFADFAAEHGTNYKMLKFLNPWLRDNTLVNSERRTYVIKIPRKGYRRPDSWEGMNE